jgi:O-antigen/teichoic acid export membrane protein
VSLNVSITYVALRGVGGALSVAAMALLARSFGPSGYAEVALAVAAALLLASVVFGPLRAALARFSDGDAQDSTVLVNLFYRSVAAIVLVGCGLSLVWTQHAPLIVAATALAIVQGAFDYSVQQASSAFEPRRVGLLYVGKSTLAVAGAIVVLWFGVPAWAAVAWLALAGALAVGSFGRDAFAHRWLPLATFPRARLAQLRAFAGPLAVVSALVFCAQWADRAVVGGSLGARSFGAYVAIADLTQQLIGMLFSGIGAAWYPRLVQASESGNAAELRRLFERYVELLWVLLVPAVIGLAVVAPSLAAVVFGQGFTVEIGFWIPLLALGAGFAGMKAFLLDVPLFLRKQMVLHAVIVTSAAVLSTVVALALVPRFGVQGAALAYCAATIAGCACSLIAVRGGARVLPDPRTFLGVAAGCAAMLATSLLIVGPSVVELMLAIAGGATIYVVVLWLLNVSDVRTAGRRWIDLIRP